MNAAMSITFSDHPTGNRGISTVSDRVPTPLHRDKSGEPGAAADEIGSNWKSTASATAKLFLRGVRDSSDAFSPLKSVAGGLCFILENCEVQSLSCMHYPTLTGAPANEGEHMRNRVVSSSG